MTTTTLRSPAPYAETYTVGGQSYPVSAILGATRQEIRKVAFENGWELVNPQTLGSFEEFRLVSAATGRTLTYVTISYSVRDGIVGGSTPRSYLNGKNKKARVLEILRTEAEKRSAK